jgi:hypothetical protein
MRKSFSHTFFFGGGGEGNGHRIGKYKHAIETIATEHWFRMWKRICFVQYISQICKFLNFTFADMCSTVNGYSPSTTRLGLIHVDAKSISFCVEENQCTLKRNSTYIFPEKELRGLSPNFYIHVSVSDLYIPTIGPPSYLQQNMHLSQEYIIAHRNMNEGIGMEYLCSAVQGRWLQCWFPALV